MHDVNCSSVYVIYLIECTLCKKQYVGKSETSFHIKLNNHRNDVKKSDAIFACRHFQERNHVFNKHEKFMIIDTLTNTTRDWLKQKFFWFKCCKRYTLNIYIYIYIIANVYTYTIYIYIIYIIANVNINLKHRSKLVQQTLKTN